jgi:predicted metal-dependent phosphotriesterase family hydrolase
MSAPIQTSSAKHKLSVTRRAALKSGTAMLFGMIESRNIVFAADNSDVNKLKIETVLGPISGDEVKKALAHEHMFVDFFGPADPNYMNVDWAAVSGTCTNRAMELISQDVNLIIEWTNIGVGRNVLLLRDVSHKTGLHIVSPTGIYKSLIPPVFAGLTVDQIAQRFVTDLTKGVDETGIKSGFIKIATTETGPTSTDTMIHRAAAIAGAETGSTISLHSPHFAATKQVIATLENEKFPLGRFVWGHAQPSKVEEHKEVASRGATVQYDAISARSDPFFNGPTDDKSMLDRVEEMVKAGYGKQILISADASAFVNPQKYQYDRDPGYVFRYFEAALASRLGAQLSSQILRDNVIRAFRAPDHTA